MTQPLRLACVVEGIGEIEALPVLLRRLVPEIDPERHADISRPLRVNRGKLSKQGEFERYLELASRGEGVDAILVLVDADDDCAGEMGPAWLARASTWRSDFPARVVIAVREYEAWFLAAAISLRGKRGLADDIEPPADPEAIRDAKGWLQQRRTDGLAYSPSVDQPALSAQFDLAAARAGSSSFDKLWRDVALLMSVDDE